MESIIIEKVRISIKESIKEINDLTILLGGKTDKSIVEQKIWEIRLKVEYSAGLLNFHLKDGIDQTEKSITKPNDPIGCLSDALENLEVTLKDLDSKLYIDGLTNLRSARNRLSWLLNHIKMI